MVSVVNILAIVNRGTLTSVVNHVVSVVNHVVSGVNHVVNYINHVVSDINPLNHVNYVVSVV